MIRQRPISTLFHYTTLFRSPDSSRCRSATKLLISTIFIDVLLCVTISEEHASEPQSRIQRVGCLLLQKQKIVGAFRSDGIKLALAVHRHFVIFCTIAAERQA